MTIEMTFDAESVPNPDFAALCGTLDSIIRGTEPELAAVALAVLTGLEREIDRRLSDDAPRHKALSLHLSNFELPADSVRASMVAFLTCRDTMLRLNKPEAAAIYDAVVVGLGQSLVAAKNEVAALEQLFEMEAPNEQN